MRTLTLRVAASAILLFSALSAGAAIKLDSQIPPNKQVRIGKLPNGLTYYIQKNALPARHVELRLIVKAGSVLEDQDQQGLAHFVEHMAFNGSTNFKKNELVSYFEKIGVKFGNDLNAYTSFDETVYMLPVPTDKKENVEKGFQVLEDWAHGINFNPEDIDAERNIIIEESRRRKGAGQRFQRVTLPKFFMGSRYADRLPIGQEDILRNVKPETLKRFYKDWYRPDLMAVVAVGDIDPDDIEALVTKHFSKLVNPASPRKREHHEIPVRTVPEALVLTDKEATQNTLAIVYGAVPVTHDQSFRTMRDNIKRNLVTMMAGERFRALSQLENSPFVGGGASFQHELRHFHTFTAQAIIGKAGLDAAVNGLVDETERMRRFGFTAGEFDRAQRNMLRSAENAKVEESKRQSVSLVGKFQANFLNDDPIASPTEEHAYLQELLAGISLEELNAMARDTIPHKAAKLVLFQGTEKQATALPDGPKLLAMVDAAAKREVVAITEKALPKALMDKVPQPGSIVSEQQDPKLGLTRLMLSNGLKVVLKQTDFKNGHVAIDAQRFGGLSQLPDAELMLARHVVSIANTQGFNGHTPTDAQKITAGKAYSINMGLNEHGERFFVNATTADLESMFQALHIRFGSMNQDESIFRGQMTRLADLTRNQMASPERKFQAAVMEALFNGHPRGARLPNPSDYEAMKLARSVDIYKQRFGSAKDFQFVIVGSFDMANMKQLLTTYVATLPTGEIPTTPRDTGVRAPVGEVKREVKAGMEKKAAMSMYFLTEAPYSNDDALRVRALAAVMSLRITEVLREKNALIYSGAMRSVAGRHPVPGYGLMTDLQFAPENADKVHSLLMAEIDAMKKNGPSETDVNKFKQNTINNDRRAVKDNGYWAATLSELLINGEQPDRILRTEEEVNKITPESLKEAANRFFGPNLVQVKLLPEG